MVKRIESMSLKHLDVIYIPSHHTVKKYTTEQNKDHSWVTKIEEPQCNGGNHTPRYSNIFHLQNLMNKTINLANVGHQDLNLCLAKIFPPLTNIKN